MQEDVEAANHLVIFYPKFHCELNFIERFWCAAKWYARENCEYSLEGLRKIVPAVLDSVSAVSINRYYIHCAWVIDAYADWFKYGTRDFAAMYIGLPVGNVCDRDVGYDRNWDGPHTTPALHKICCIHPKKSSIATKLEIGDHYIMENK